MKIKSVIIFSFFILLNNILYAQDKFNNSNDDNNIYIVMMISLLIWIALSIYIYALNRKVKSLEKKFIDE